MSSQFTAAETRRNYLLLVAEGILFTVGLVFFDPNTVLPLLMERMTGSAVLVGVVGSVEPLAKGIAPILSGNWISSLAHKKPFLISAMAVGRLPLWLLGLALIWIPESPAYLWAALILLVQVLFWFGDATGDPAWMDMVGKAVPDNRRGRFFATRQVVGGVLAVAAGTAVAAILDFDGFTFPVNYGVVITIAAVLYLFNLGTFFGMKEHASSTSDRHSLGLLIRKLPSYLTAHPTFGLTMLVLILFNSARLSLPFYIIFGQQQFGLTERALAVFIPLQMAGRIIGTLTWGGLGDRFGHQRAIKAVSVVCVIPPVIAFTAAYLIPGSLGAVSAYVPFALIFFLIGAYLEGWPAFINHMLETVPEHDRPRYAGLMGIGYVPAVLAPVVGGVIIQRVGYPALFSLTAIITITGAVAALLLRPPARLKKS